MAPNLKKKRYLLVVLLVVMGTLLSFLPFFLSAGPVRQFAVAQINSRIPGNLTVDSWLIGWQQGILCQDISYVNPDKGLRINIPRLTSTQGLLELILFHKNLGQVALESPLIELTDRQDSKQSMPVGTGAGRSGQARNSAWEQLAVQVEIRGGQIKVVSDRMEREAGIKDVVFHSFLSEGIVEYDMGFHLLHDQGSVDLTGTVNLPARQSAFFDTLVTETAITISSLQVRDFLNVAALKTSTPGGKGIVNGFITLRTSGLDSGEVSGSLDVTDLRLSGGLLGQDSPSFQSIHVDVDKADWSKHRWTFSELNISSDAGTLQAESRHASEKTTLQGQGKVNLPVLFDLFPNLLKIQDSTLIETGDLDFDVDLAVSDRKISLDLKSRVESFGGLYDDQPFAWDKPVAVIFSGEREGSEVNVTKFIAEAPFVRASGHGNLSEFDLVATADLDQTFVELNKLFRMQWTGSGKLNMAVQASSLAADDERYRFNADFNIDDFSLKKDDRVVVPKHNMGLLGSGYAPVSMLRERHGNLDLRFALSSWLGDIFITLDADKKQNGSWSGDFSTDTNINLSDLSGFMHLTEILPTEVSMAGDAQIQGAGNFNDAYVRVRELDSFISNFSLERDGVTFSDRNIHLSIDQSVNDEVSSITVHDLVVSDDREEFLQAGAGMTGIGFQEHSLYLYNLALVAETGNLWVERLILPDWKNPYDTLNSNIRLLADLAQLTALFHSSGMLSPEVKFSGEADLLLDIIDRGNGVSEVVSEVELADLALVKQDARILVGEDAELITRFIGNLTSGNIELKKLHLSSVPLDVEAHGIVTRIGEDKEIELQGTMTPDLVAISQIIKSGFDIDLSMQGRNSEHFSVRYPLGKSQTGQRREKIQVAASISADSIKYQGIDLLSFALPLQFKDSNLQFALTGRLNGGRLNLQSDCDFRGDPPVIIVPEASQAMSDVQLEKPLVEGVFKQIHPLFGVLGRPFGKVDVRLDSFTWPLIKQGGNEAVFVTGIDTSEMSLESTDLMQSILALFGMEHEKLTLQDSNIICSGRDGRISCSPIRILVADSEMVVSGSVGMDKSLDYLLQVPVTRKLVGKEGYRVLEGATVNVPIRGTIDNPVFDKKTVSATVQDLMKQVASKVVVEQVEKILPELLNDVLAPQKKK